MIEYPFGHLAPDSFDLTREITAVMQPRINKDVQSVLSKLCTLVANQDRVIDVLEERVSRLESKLKEECEE